MSNESKNDDTTAATKPSTHIPMMKPFRHMLRTIAKEQNLELVTKSHGWINIFRSKELDVDCVLYGTSFPLNGQSCSKLAADKTATSMILDLHDVPHVPHFLATNPHMIYSGFENSGRALAGTWPSLISMLHKYSILVLKPKEGSMGRSTYKVHNQLEMEQAWMDLLAKRRDFCISPFVYIENEYRCIFLDNEMYICFRKNVPCVVGDGSSTVATLIAAYEQVVHKKMTLTAEVQSKLDSVLKKDETLFLDWCHNLSRGSRADKVVSEDLHIALKSLGSKTMKALGLRFASVDIVRLKETEASSSDAALIAIPENRLLVLEVNGSVSVGGYVTQHPEDFDTAQEMFSQAVKIFFEENGQKTRT
jgi:D-alanine-D-alanine ligase-like ATP-grasp enzyme